MGQANTKLWDAVETGDTQTLNEVLNHKEADVNNEKTFKIANKMGLGDNANRDIMTPLHIACEKGNREIVRILLERGALPKIKALHERFNDGDGILDEGGGAGGTMGGGQGGLQGQLVDVDSCEYIKYAQYTPLYFACKNAHIDVVLDLLLLPGEPLKMILDEAGGGGGGNMLQGELAKSSHEQIWDAIQQIVRMLVMYNADYAACLCNVVAQSNLLMMDLLIKMGANVNGYDCDAIERVILERKPPVSPFYNPKIVSHDKRPLAHAAAKGDINLVRLLLRYGAVITEQDVHRALEGAHQDVVELLLETQQKQQGNSAFKPGHHQPQQQIILQPKVAPPQTNEQYLLQQHEQLLLNKHYEQQQQQQQQQLLMRDSAHSQNIQQQPQQQQPAVGGYDGSSAPPGRLPPDYPDRHYDDGVYNKSPSSAEMPFPSAPPADDQQHAIIIIQEDHRLQNHHNYQHHHALSESAHNNHNNHQRLLRSSDEGSGNGSSDTTPHQNSNNPFGDISEHGFHGADTPLAPIPSQHSAAQQPQQQQSQPQHPAPSPQDPYSGGQFGRAPYGSQPPPQHHQPQQRPTGYPPQGQPYYGLGQPGAPQPRGPPQNFRAPAGGAPYGYPMHFSPHPAHQAHQQILTPSPAAYPVGLRAGPQYPPRPVEQQGKSPYGGIVEGVQGMGLGGGGGGGQEQGQNPFGPPPPRGYSRSPPPYNGPPPPYPHQKPFYPAPQQPQQPPQQPQQTHRHESDLSVSSSVDDSWEVDPSEIVLDKEIARGSFGIVYYAKFRGTEVAVKKLINQNLTPEQLKEFNSEVNIMKKLHHPNVLLLMGVCTKSPNLCMVMEFMAGSLWDLLHKAHDVRFDWKMIMSLITGTAKGMNYLHLSKPPILHRDLKTPNLLVDKHCHVKICDFGLARLKASFMTGNLGTPQYMAPEIIKSENYTESADVYSFGIVMWEIVTRQPPFHGVQPMQIAFGVVQQGMRPRIPSTVPLPLSTLMTECWSHDPRQRPTFSAILERLKGINL